VNHLIFVLLVFVGTTALSLTLVPVASALARRLGVLDQPGHRKVHDNPTPRLGGLAVFLSFSAVVASGHWLVPLLRGVPAAQPWIGEALVVLEQAHLVKVKLLGIVIGATLAFCVGFADDVLGARFPVALKAGGQLLAATVMVVAGVRVTFLPWEWMNIVVTVLWIVGMTNAFNLLDNMDGLSAGVASVASVVLLINAWAQGQFFVSLILVAFLGSLLGFLVYNFNPASVFLGDCGSLFIGFVMSSLTLLERYVTTTSGTLFPVLMPVVVLAVPVIDTLTVIVIRVREGRPIYVGDNRHLSHRLVSLGFSKRATVLFIYLATLSLGLGATSLRTASLGQSVLILVQTAGFIALLLILMFVDRQEGRTPR
jgi:UDP-GlcNAc:undecaprenyl-phosphate GlcNAc-1-phosphate transferase